MKKSVARAVVSTSLPEITRMEIRQYHTVPAYTTVRLHMVLFFSLLCPFYLITLQAFTKF